MWKPYTIEHCQSSAFHNCKIIGKSNQADLEWWNLMVSSQWNISHCWCLKSINWCITLPFHNNQMLTDRTCKFKIFLLKLHFLLLHSCRNCSSSQKSMFWLLLTGAESVLSYCWVCWHSWLCIKSTSALCSLLSISKTAHQLPSWSNSSCIDCTKCTWKQIEINSI